MGRFNSAVGLFGLAALYVYLGGVSGTPARPFVEGTAATTATTALDSPIAMSMAPYVPDGAALFFGGAAAIVVVETSRAESLLSSLFRISVQSVALPPLRSYSLALPLFLWD
ncbi:hypothetical protein L1887_48218 [Cichorium endivia]|uniref:Uncharacterized protein n=1 Tax=Pseudozyma antarctica (strain T-34) TaxID=1151754 RepID=M9M1K9_PSEA3|nr:hypothetical protein L1887_48218 [Cichorium endivia]GAC77534.1 hypothetical protein PANT_26d00100 [Moesziomyces antarcticus T-34]